MTDTTMRMTTTATTAPIIASDPLPEGAPSGSWVDVPRESGAVDANDMTEVTSGTAQSKYTSTVTAIQKHTAQPHSIHDKEQTPLL